MSTPSNVTLRATIGRPLLYEELDTNFQELKYVITEYLDTVDVVNTKIGDAPSNGSQYVRINGSWNIVSTTSTTWGGIVGTLSDQTDLHNRFNSVEDDVVILDDVVTLLSDDVTTLENQVNSIEPTITVTGVDKTLINTEKCFTTVSGLTITLPVSPVAGNLVAIGVGKYKDTVVSAGVENIMSIAEDMIIDSENTTVTLLYVNNTQGWRIL